MLTIVVPVYNEHESIENLLESLHEKVKTPFEVMLVYDREEDTTLPIVRGLLPKLPFKLTMKRNAYDSGALNAIKTGLLHTDSEAILVTMADSSDDLRDVDAMYRRFEFADVVCGSRYMAGGRQMGGPLIKRTLSRLAGVSLWWLCRIPTHDVTNSFKMYRRSFVQAIRIESHGGFEIGMELTVKAYKMGYRISEVPTVWRDREGGQSNFKLWSWLPSYLKWYFYALFAKRTDRVGETSTTVEERVTG